MAVGAIPLGNAPLIEVDPERYRAEIDLKRRLLTAGHADCFQAGAVSPASRWEVAELIFSSLSGRYPDSFSLEAGRIWRFRNRLLGEVVEFEPGRAGLDGIDPLDGAGRHVQEDLLVVGASAGLPLLGGQLCFPSRWSLAEKLGMPLIDVHREVPGFATQIGRSSVLLLERLRAGRPVWRANWSLPATGRLDLLTRPGGGEKWRTRAKIDRHNAGRQCWFRTERQVLVRLERSGDVLFTIHTRVRPLAEVAADPGRAGRLARAIRTMPEAMRAYKGITECWEELVIYLEERAAAPAAPDPARRVELRPGAQPEAGPGRRGPR